MNNFIKRSFVLIMALVVGFFWIETHAAKPEKVEVTAANPNAALQGEALDVVISGSGFGHGSTVRFLVTGTRDDTQIGVGSVDYDEVSGALVASIQVDDAAQVVDYDIEVRTSSGRRGKGTTLFRVRHRDGGGSDHAECIVFTGDLETVPGFELLEGCCPNAGPWPAYSMILHLLDEDDIAYEGQYDGQLFMSGFSPRPPRARTNQYKVQFWSWDSDTETPGVGDVFFEIYGGDVVEDKKNKTLTVTFTEEQPTLWLYDDECCAIEAPVLPVSFELFRSSDQSYCE